MIVLRHDMTTGTTQLYEWLGLSISMLKKQNSAMLSGWTVS